MIEWDPDPAASGPRWRARHDLSVGPRNTPGGPVGGEDLIAYEDGRWYVRTLDGCEAEGRAASLERAKMCCEAIYMVCTGRG